MVDLKLTIPSGFLLEETRCGYTISQQMKQVWAIQLDLFAEFDRVCRKHNIVYIASGGTMLGTVRHHGYIPWDDDVDLMMMRDQYDKLCEVAPSEFKYPYFFQTESSEPGVHRWFARLRNSETTAIQKRELVLHPKYNQGIFIDIFPLDGVPDEEGMYQRQYKAYSLYRKLYYRFLSVENPIWSDNDSRIKAGFKKGANMLFGAPSRALHLAHWAFNKVEEACKAYSESDTELVSLLSFEFENLGHALRRSDMNHIIEMDFEFLKMPVIANYDEHLKRKYGDYMTPLMNPSYHGEVIFDTDISYKEYYTQHPELSKRHRGTGD